MAATPTTTTTQRLAPAGRSSSFSSARMLEAQRMFQNAVKHELQLLLVSGTKREDAVKLLLGRIVASTEPPEATAVRGVMRQFQMNYDDAMRALIVKQELGRLKRQGLDSFAAIEELTRKMKRQEEEEEEEGEEEVEMEEKGEERFFLGEDNGEERDGDAGGVEQDKVGAAVLGEATVAVKLDEKGSETTSLSLCQRIGKVSISSATVTEQESDEGLRGEEKDDDGEHEAAGEECRKTGFRSPSRVQNSLEGNLVELTPQSRKRRAAFGEQLDTATRSRSSSSERTMKPMFSGVKKQKLCANVGDGFLQIVTRKSKSMSSSPPKGTAAKSTSGIASGGGKGGGSTRSERNTKNLLKRQRASPAGMADNDESPIADEPRASHVHHRHHAHHHHSKRQKSGSPH